MNAILLTSPQQKIQWLLNQIQQQSIHQPQLISRVTKFAMLQLNFFTLIFFRDTSPEVFDDSVEYAVKQRIISYFGDEQVRAHLDKKWFGKAFNK